MRRLATVLTVLALVVVPGQRADAAPPRLRAAALQTGLTYTWDVAFAPDGRMLVTERDGRIRVYAGRGAGDALLHTRTVERVRAEGESGLMGIAVTRKAGRTFVFVCASRTTSRGWRNQVLRY